MASSQQTQAWSVLWMIFAMIGILEATPVLTGSLMWLPLRMWTDRFGGRLVFFVLVSN